MGLCGNLSHLEQDSIFHGDAKYNFEQDTE